MTVVELAPTLFKLHIDSELSDIFYTSIVRSVPNSYVKDNEIYIKCNKLEPYSKNVGKWSCVNLIKSLVTQITHLEASGINILGFSPDDILVVDDKIFIAINANHSAYICNNMLKWCSTASLPVFSAPELHDIKTLPAIIPLSAWKYSLGLLILNNLKMDLDKMAYSKLRAFIMRCLDEDPENRFVLIDAL
jgi:hypothetical protein